MAIKNIIIKVVGLIFGLSPIWFMAHPNLAISATATPSSETVVQEIKQRIIQNAVNDKLKLVQLVGLVGKISDLKQNSFTLTTISDSVQVSYSTQSASIKENKPIKTSDISINDKAIVIGRFTDSNVLDASRIIVVNDTPPIIKKLVIATIVNVDKTAKTIKIKTDNLDMTLTPSKKLTLEFDKLKPGTKIAAITLPSSNPKSPSTLLKLKSF